MIKKKLIIFIPSIVGGGVEKNSFIMAHNAKVMEGMSGGW